MNFRVYFTLNNSRQTPAASGYRPSWANLQPESHSGSIHFLTRAELPPGESCEGILIPAQPEYWNDVEPGDTLEAMEGSRVVGEAEVLEILT